MERYWPVGRRIEVVWKDVLTDYDTGLLDPEMDGQTYRDGSSIVIEMARRHCRSCVMATMRHEFGHAKLWGHSRVEHLGYPHPPHFWTLLGEIEDLWNEIGWEEASDVEVE